MMSMINLKEIFKNEYAVQTNERLILEGLANLAMKPNKTTNELLTRITRTVRVIKKSFEIYGAITHNHHLTTTLTMASPTRPSELSNGNTR